MCPFFYFLDEYPIISISQCQEQNKMQISHFINDKNMLRYI